VSYSYNGYRKVATRTDAKGQQVVYTYDGYARLTKVHRYPQGTAMLKTLASRRIIITIRTRSMRAIRRTRSGGWRRCSITKATAL